jgi:hypothetical protein
MCRWLFACACKPVRWGGGYDRQSLGRGPCANDKNGPTPSSVLPRTRRIAENFVVACFVHLQVLSTDKYVFNIITYTVFVLGSRCERNKLPCLAPSSYLLCFGKLSADGADFAFRLRDATISLSSPFESLVLVEAAFIALGTVDLSAKAL